VFEASMLEAKAKVKARHLRGQGQGQGRTHLRPRLKQQFSRLMNV